MEQRANKFDFPTGMNRFNWGAFFLGWIWAACMESVKGVILSLVLGFIGNLILGFQGNRMAWESREFKSLEDFIRVQEEWAKWGLIVFIIFFSISAVATIISFFIIYQIANNPS